MWQWKNWFVIFFIILYKAVNAFWNFTYFGGKSLPHPPTPPRSLVTHRTASNTKWAMTAPWPKLKISYHFIRNRQHHNIIISANLFSKFLKHFLLPDGPQLCIFHPDDIFDSLLLLWCVFIRPIHNNFNNYRWKFRSSLCCFMTAKWYSS